MAFTTKNLPQEQIVSRYDPATVDKIVEKASDLLRKGVIDLDKAKVEVGDAVVYVDPVGKHHKAIVTAAWSYSCINLVLVSEDVTKTDTYGRQIERQTSMMHSSSPGRAHGFFWFKDSIDELVDQEHKPKSYSA